MRDLVLFCFDIVRSHTLYYFEKGICLKLDVQGQERMLDVDRHGAGVFKIGQFPWTSYVYYPLNI